MPSRRSWPLLLSALALVAGLAPVAAHPVAHPGAPRIVNVRPGGGAVVGAGVVQIAALAVGSEPITGASLRVDGVPVEVARSGEQATHQTVSGTVTVGEGQHVAELIVADRAGRRTQRAWRFAASGLRVGRLSGEGRVATAVAVSRDLYPADASARAAVLARADDFPDALAGVPFATQVDAPLLLSDQAALPAATAAELRRVLLPGSTVFLLGGASALSEQVERDVAALGFVPERLRGNDRYGTAVALARLVPVSRTAVVVSGETFADALAVSSPAAMNGYPVLLTTAASLPSATAAYLEERDFDSLVVVGGTKAVGNEVYAQLEQVVGAGNVERLAGPGRYDTAARVASRFFPAAASVSVANGERFPDALAGGRHAAARRAPLLLSPAARLLDPQAEQVAAFQPQNAVLYGGSAALTPRVTGDLHRARLDVGAARLVSVAPADGSPLNAVDQLVLEFDRNLVVEHSTVYLTIGDHEVPGSIAMGDFENTIVFTASELPAVTAGTTYPLRVSGVVYDGSGWRHFALDYTYRKLDLARGDTGPLVLDLQRRLEASGYWVGTPDGVYGTLTAQAVMAVQKVHGLARTGVYGSQTRAIVESGRARPTPRSTSGRVVEIDLARQVLLLTRNGAVEWVFNTSTGNNRPYTVDGETYTATTPTGRFRINREIDGIRESRLGTLYRPKYFTNAGHAIHGSASVPAYPASHGCVRVTNPAMDWMWNTGQLPIGTSLWVY